MSESPPASAESASFAAEVERVRQSGQLGRGTQMQRMFEFLVACQAQGRVPKELEIAVGGFGRGADFDVAQDATVRVTAHKLRRRLEDFYREEGAAAPHRLTLPRGEYRLTLESAAVPVDAAVAAAKEDSWLRRERTAWIVAGLLGALCLALLVALLQRPDVDARVARVRESPLWAPLLEDALPIQLVLGDYYIFGETDGSGVVRRLIRDFEVNSQQDLEQRFIADPRLATQFADLKLGYLPTSSAQALREVLPVVTASGKHVTLTLASELDPSTIKTTHVIYRLPQLPGHARGHGVRWLALCLRRILRRDHRWRDGSDVGQRCRGAAFGHRALHRLCLCGQRRRSRRGAASGHRGHA
ncbi:MAG: hypothetical protein IPG49_01610 [Proteobacteria bacterium]|nr:hypothetical protein [Pseudomonadota bacterium]